MIKEIEYKEYSTVPADGVNNEGDLALVSGLSHDSAGQLVPELPRKILGELPKGWQIWRVHDVILQDNVILSSPVENGYELRYIDKKDLGRFSEEDITKPIIAKIENANLRDVQIMGHTLVVFDSIGVGYALWKDNNYLYLGQDLPYINLEFGLEAETIVEELEQQDIGASDFGKRTTAQAIKFIRKWGADKNRFIYPFFVRWALRLYDGEHVMHSAPVLMMASSQETPQLKEHISSKKKMFKMLAHRLCLRPLSAEQKESLLKWEDIISGIDIFVSPPLYSIDQSKEDIHTTIYSSADDLRNLTIARFKGWYTSPSNEHLVYDQADKNDSEYREITNLRGASYLTLPLFAEEERREAVLNNNAFFLLHRYTNVEIRAFSNIDIYGRNGIQYTNDLTPLPLKDGRLSSLLQQEQLLDDWRSHDRLMAQSAYVYNNRIHMIGCSYMPFSGFPLKAQTIYTSRETVLVSIYYHIKENGQEWVLKTATERVARDVLVPYLYHPHKGAYLAIIEKQTEYGETEQCRISLAPHPFLSGSHAFLGWNNQLKDMTFVLQDSLKVQSPSPIVIGRKIISSQVNNPFYYSAKDVNSVGMGDVLALSTSTEALSQGQFGQHPVYAFTSEGVWALSLTTAGGFHSVQPITRDVLTSANSLCQTDSAIVFATQRGIVMLSGATTRVLSTPIEGKAGFKIPNAFMELAIDGQSDAAIAPTLSFAELLSKCRIFYDYTGGRIFIFAPQAAYAYVYSLTSKRWTILSVNLSTVINAYPSVWGVEQTEHGQRIVDIGKADTSSGSATEPDKTETYRASWLTRPLDLGYPNRLKTIRAIVQRGKFAAGHVKTALYGSRDLINYKLLGSSNTHELRGLGGTPYRYFLIGGVADLAEGETLTGCGVEFEIKYDEKLR